jgi:hypothetical protein
MSLEQQIWSDAPDDLPPEFSYWTADEIRRQTMQLETQGRMYRDEANRLTNDIQSFQEKV